MPVIAVVVAVAVDVAAVGAAVGGTLTLLGAVAAVGATVAAIGSVTKDKALMMAGTVIGAVGAIGSLAAGAGLLGDAASAPLFGAAPAASTADAASAGTVAAFSSGGASGADSAAAATGAIDPATGAITAQAAVGAVDPATGIPVSSMPTESAVPLGTDVPGVAKDLSVHQAAVPQPDASGVTNSTANTVISGEQPAAPLPSGGAPAVPAPTGPGTSQFSPGGASGADSATIGDKLGGVLNAVQNSSTGKAVSGLLAFADAHPMVAYGALQAGGSLLSGMTSSLTPAQVAALDAQAAANNAATALAKQQTANLAMPKAVASSAPVTGAPQTLVPGASSQVAAVAPAGFINQAPKTLVTGAPA